MQHARREAEDGERFLEFRLDYLDQPSQGFRAIQGFPDAVSRRYDSGHLPAAPESWQVQRQRRGADPNSRIGDRCRRQRQWISRSKARKRSAPRPRTCAPRTCFVLSYHNFETTPNLDPVLRRMLKISADAYKIVTTARKPSDIQRVLGLAKSNPRVPLVLLAMGEVGFPVRILSTALGRALHLRGAEFGSRHGGRAGQRTDPAQSLPHRALHASGQGLRRDRRPGRPFDLARRPQSRLPGQAHGRRLPSVPRQAGAPEGLHAAGRETAGGGIQRHHPAQAENPALSGQCRSPGAADRRREHGVAQGGTLARHQHRRRRRHRTAWPKRLRLAKSSVLLVGNGGAARGAAFALVDAGAKLAIVGRNPDRVRALAKICDAEPLLREQMNGRYFDAVVHATPLGMHPHTEECFFAEAIPGRPGLRHGLQPDRDRCSSGVPGSSARKWYRASRCSWSRRRSSSRSGPASRRPARPWRRRHWKRSALRPHNRHVFERDPPPACHGAGGRRRGIGSRDDDSSRARRRPRRRAGADAQECRSRSPKSLFPRPSIRPSPFEPEPWPKPSTTSRFSSRASRELNSAAPAE